MPRKPTPEGTTYIMHLTDLGTMALRGSGAKVTLNGKPHVVNADDRKSFKFYKRIDNRTIEEILTYPDFLSFKKGRIYMPVIYRSTELHPNHQAYQKAASLLDCFRL